MSSALVSVVMPVFNAEKTIRGSLNSVLGQTYDNIEVLVYDDCSTDDSAQIIEQISKDSVFTITFTKAVKNKGVAFARNSCLEKAKGKYVAFCDSDDIWLTTKIEKQVALLEETGEACCHTSYYRCNADMRIRSLDMAKSHVRRSDLYKRNYIGLSTAILFKQLALECSFDENLKHEDYQFWIDVLRRVQSIGIKEPLTLYRVSGDSLSAQKTQTWRWYFSILYKNFGLSKALVGFPVYLLNGVVKVWKNR